MQILDQEPEEKASTEEKKEEEKKGEGEDEKAEDKKDAPAKTDSDGEGVKKEEPPNKRKRKRQEYNEDEDSGTDSSDEDNPEEPPPGMENNKAEKETNGKDEEHKDEEDAKTNEEENNESSEPKPRALHKTASIFLRNLAPTITKQEVEAMCKRYPGFLRAAIADPQHERRWFRRGWITFERDVKIKEICYSLNNIRLRDFELGPIVNRDLSRRIRTVNGITVDRKVVRNDIKLAAKVITNLDKRWGLWLKPQEKPQDADKAQASLDMGIISNNPILNNITDYLIEEASAEEEELLGRNNDLEDGEEGEEGNKVVRDEELIKVLDNLLFYLRIVHSVDFYNHSEYPNEDEMPNRWVDHI